MKSLAVLRVMVPALALLCGGCVSQVYEVSVSAFAAPEKPPGSKYVIMSAVKGVDAGDLEFQEYARAAAKAIEGTGLSRVSTLAEADLAVFLFYGLGNPRERNYSFSLPTYGQTGVASSATYGTVRATGAGSATYTANTYNTPSYGVTGYQSFAGSYTVFTRMLSLDAVDLAHYRRTQEVRSLWKVTMVSSGSSGDLRAVIPAMLYAGRAYIGKNTGKALYFEVPVDDPKLAPYRSDLPAEK